MYTFDCEAVATYVPADETARAVITPLTFRSDIVAVLDHVERDIILRSILTRKCEDGVH